MLAPLLAAVLVLLLALAGCSAGGGGLADSGDAKAASDTGDGGSRAGGREEGAAGKRAGSGPAASRAASVPQGVHLERTASLTMRVKDVPGALERAREVAAGAGGLVGEEATDRDGAGRERSRVVLRVPQESFEEVVARLAQGPGTLVRRSQKAKDVTRQVVDVDSRVKSLRASVTRVRALMDDATKISDVTALEGELSTREADLEALLAQQASLRDRTSFATITLTLSRTAQAAHKAPKEEAGFVSALGDGWHAFVATLRVIGVVLGAVLPFAVAAAVLVPLALLARGFVRRRRTPEPRPAPNDQTVPRDPAPTKEGPRATGVSTPTEAPGGEPSLQEKE
ncbi:DUF4349 domain-containing protein [Streptomyces sp. NPDC007088]|uniref:DUF4349 domain-containing protein n=1 Tax=Streptomyces sp. NPDC007088 TaxID=3364773 RepID=UPI00367DF49F